MVIFIIAVSLFVRGPDVVDTLSLHKEPDANVVPSHDLNKLEMVSKI